VAIHFDSKIAKKYNNKKEFLIQEARLFRNILNIKIEKAKKKSKKISSN
jgi:hypothetical protein